MESKEVLIIGGGWSGIGVAGCLSHNNFEDYKLLEQTESFGGFWGNHTYNSVRMHDLSRLYRTPPHIATKYENRFLTRLEVPQYLTEYANHYNVTSHTKFNFKVTKISYLENKDEEHKWLVVGKTKGIEQSFRCKFLCIATSYCRIPLIPEPLKQTMPNFRGQIMHSNAYKSPSDFDISKHKRILIIGGGHSSAEISTELSDAGFQVDIAHRGGQYFMKQDDWSAYLSKQNLERSLEYFKFSMADAEFKGVVESFDKQFENMIYAINDDIHWKTPSLSPGFFILFHKKTFIDDSHFFDLLLSQTICIRGPVSKIVENGVLLEGSTKVCEYDGIILCTGFSHGLEEFLDDSQQYLSEHRYEHLPRERAVLPKTNGRCKSLVKENLYFPGFDYGVNQRVDFALYSWHVGESILSKIRGSEFKPELNVK